MTGVQWFAGRGCLAGELNWAHSALIGLTTRKNQITGRTVPLSIQPLKFTWKLHPLKRIANEKISNSFLYDCVAIVRFSVLVYKQTKDELCVAARDVGMCMLKWVVIFWVLGILGSKRRGEWNRCRIIRSNGCHTRPLLQIPICFHHGSIWDWWREQVITRFPSTVITKKSK